MEKYGQAPKRFTKEWWEHFWEYYKLHTIVALAILGLCLSTIIQIASKVESDMVLTLAGEAIISQENQDEIAKRLSDAIGDGNDDGKIRATIQDLSMAKSDAADLEFAYAVENRLQLELATGEGYLYIMDYDKADQYLSMDGGEELFLPSAQWADGNFGHDKLLTYNNTPYAVSLADSQILAELGIDANDLYVLIRRERSDEANDKSIEKLQENAVIASNILIAE